MTDPLQHALFHDSVEDAIGTVVAATGGYKAVGVDLWPEKSADEAGRLLRNCLASNRAEKLSIEQIIFLLRRGHEKGVHTAMHFLATACGYQPPAPVTPEDREAELRRQYIESVKMQAQIAKQMERFYSHPMRVAK